MRFESFRRPFDRADVAQLRRVPGYFRMLIAREITSPATPSDTHASTIMSSLAHRLTAETSVGLKAVAVQNASDR